MFSVIMLVLQFLGSRLYLRVDGLAAGCHLGNFLQNDCIVDCFVSVFAPGKGSMVLAQDCRNRFIVPVLEIFRNEKARVLLIRPVNLLFCQASDAGNLPLHIICMGGAVAGNASSRLCPACSPGRMCMYDSADVWKCLVQLNMCGCIGGWIIFPLNFVAI